MAGLNVLTTLTIGALVLIVPSVPVKAEVPVDKAWYLLKSGAKDKDSDKRGKAIQSLGLISGSAEAQSAAEAALIDEHEEVRAAAADALGLMGAKSALPRLRAMLKDPATAVVFASANAMFVLGDPDAYGVYYAVLTGQKKTGDPLVDSQMKMLKDPKALGRLGLEAGLGFIPFGGVSYKVVRRFTDDAVSPVRAAAAIKLTNDPDPKSGEALARMSQDPKWLVRAAAVAAIARRGDPALVNTMIPLLDDENDVVRFNAAAAAIKLASISSKAKPAHRSK